MRGNRVAVGDIGAVSCGTRVRRYTAVGDDGGNAGREFDAGVVGGHITAE
jgi:hypothetical protein